MKKPSQCKLESTIGCRKKRFLKSFGYIGYSLHNMNNFKHYFTYDKKTGGLSA